MVQRSLAEEATRPLALIAFSVLFGFFVYLYFRFIHSPYQAFAGTGVKGPKPKLLLGSSLEYMRRGEMQVYHKFYQTYGPVFGFYLGTRPVLVVADSTLVDLVLAADCHTLTTTQQQQFLMSTLSVHGLPSTELQLENEDDQKTRKTLRSILFLPKLLKLMVPIVLNNFDTLLNTTLEKCVDSPSVDIWSVYEPYCLNVVLSVLGLSSGRLSSQISAAVSSYFNAVNRSGSTELILRSLFGSVPCLEGMMRNLSRRAKAESEFNALVDMVSDAVREARKHHTRDGVKCNYLQVLLDHPLTDDQVVSYSLLTLLVGYHTTSSCLSYTTYQLAANPLEQQKLHSEVVSNSVKRETMFYETVNSLEFLDAVIQESLRLHCLTPKLSRVCVKDCSLKGTTIRRDTRIEIPVNFIHHLRSYWSNPYSFSPDRFTDQQPHLSHKCPVSSSSSSSFGHHTFLPFGRGSHKCLGMRFTIACVKLSLTEVVQRFKFSRPLNTQVLEEMQLPGCLDRRPSHGLHVTVTTRHKFKRLMSFATVVKSAMDRQTVADMSSP